jgi:hypothetical protein
MKFYWLVVGVLAVWRITHLLHAEDGPRDVFVRVRRRAGNGFWGDVLGCFYCLSLWIAAPFAWSLGESMKEKLLLWPALSAASIAIQRLSAVAQQEREPDRAVYFEIPEVAENVLLRKDEGSPEDAGRVHQPDRSW